MVAAGCRHDGREMRPALASQNGSVSTSAAPTVPDTEDDFFDTAAASDPALPGGPIEPSTTAAAGTGPSTLAPLVSSLTVTAPWRDGSPIDARYTCKGDNVSPALSWTKAPSGTQEIAVTMIDQDASFDHWTMTGIAPDVTSLAENTAPEGAVEALNGKGGRGYTGPCPPAAATHVYRITVHYLDRPLQLAADGSADDMRSAIDDATIATARGHRHLHRQLGSVSVSDHLSNVLSFVVLAVVGAPPRAGGHALPVESRPNAQPSGLDPPSLASFLAGAVRARRRAARRHPSADDPAVAMGMVVGNRWRRQSGLRFVHGNDGHRVGVAHPAGVHGARGGRTAAVRQRRGADVPHRSAVLVAAPSGCSRWCSSV